MFGDFERQALFEAADVPLESFLASRARRRRCSACAINCRNTPRIARWVSMLGGPQIRPTPASGVRTRDHPPHALLRDDAEQVTMLVGAPRRAVSTTGYEGQDIVMLSFKRDGAAAAQLNVGALGRPGATLRRLRQRGELHALRDRPGVQGTGGTRSSCSPTSTSCRAREQSASSTPATTRPPSVSTS